MCTLCASEVLNVVVPLLAVVKVIALIALMLIALLITILVGTSPLLIERKPLAIVETLLTVWKVLRVSLERKRSKWSTGKEHVTKNRDKKSV